jgi:hypothetical protein
MKPFDDYSGEPPAFWAHVKLVSERLGYSKRVPRGEMKRLRRFNFAEILGCLQELGLEGGIVDGSSSSGTGERLVNYLNYRADVLEGEVEPNLMDRDAARAEFERLRAELNPTCALPMNKQKGEKRHHAYLVGIVNMLTEQALGGRSFNADPRGLTVATRDGAPLRTFSRWMDGAFPDVVDPHAVWEVKEYYGTKTFGSRVADGVYETMLDGHELGEMEQREGLRVRHYLMVDDHFTWWDCGRSYLCRMVDMLHVGLVDEVLFGREVLSRWPQIVATWP